MALGDPQRPAPSLRPSDAPPSASGTDPTHDLGAALHEVSNALTVLLGWVDVARAASTPEALAAALDVVGSRAAHARDIARRAIGGAPASAPPSPLEVLLSDVAHALSVEARRADLTLAVDIDPAAAALPLASGPALLQVLTNLLLNAIAFSPSGAEVRLSARPAGSDRVLLSVEDQGPGVPAEMRERLFEAGVTSRRGGAGIGLRHSAALAARAGGALRLGEASQGTRFDLDWPVSQEDAAGHVSGERPAAHSLNDSSPRSDTGAARSHVAPSIGEPTNAPEAAASGLGPPARAAASGLGPPAQAAASGLRSPAQAAASGLRPPAQAEDESAPRPVAVRHAIDGARILVVEDDDAVIELLELALEARGASVVSIKQRADLPLALASGAFDAALLDMSPLLGDVDGAVEELRRASPGARLVVMSGSVPQAEIGAAAVWVRKPFEVREIVDALGAGTSGT